MSLPLQEQDIVASASEQEDDEEEHDEEESVVGSEMDVDEFDDKPALPDRPSAVARDLHAMPTLRNVVLRAGKTESNITRGSNLEARLAQMVGDIVDPGCDHCSRSNPCGPYVGCVVVSGLLSGSCANCHYLNMGARCSLRPQATLESVRSAIDAAAASDPFTTPTPSAGPVSIAARRLSAAQLTTTPLRNATRSISASAPGSSGQPRLSRADRFRAMATQHRALADLNL